MPLHSLEFEVLIEVLVLRMRGGLESVHGFKVGRDVADEGVVDLSGEGDRGVEVLEELVDHRFDQEVLKKVVD